MCCHLGIVVPCLSTPTIDLALPQRVINEHWHDLQSLAATAPNKGGRLLQTVLKYSKARY